MRSLFQQSWTFDQASLSFRSERQFFLWFINSFPCFIVICTQLLFLVRSTIIQREKETLFSLFTIPHRFISLLLEKWSSSRFHHARALISYRSWNENFIENLKILKIRIKYTIKRGSRNNHWYLNSVCKLIILNNWKFRTPSKGSRNQSNRDTTCLFKLKYRGLPQILSR